MKLNHLSNNILGVLTQIIVIILMHFVLNKNKHCAYTLFELENCLSNSAKFHA